MQIGHFGSKPSICGEAVIKISYFLFRFMVYLGDVWDQTASLKYQLELEFSKTKTFLLNKNPKMHVTAFFSKKLTPWN